MTETGSGLRRTRRVVVPTILLAAMATSVAAQDGRKKDDDHDKDHKNALVLKTQGAGPFGGTRIGEPDSSLRCDHGYVEWQIPVKPRKVPLLMIHASSTRTWETTWHGEEGFRPIFLRRGWSVYQTDLPRTGRAGQGCAPTTYEPDVGFDQRGFTTWRLGIWIQGGGDSVPEFYPGVQFPVDDPAALDEFMRIQYPEFNAPENEQVETDALVVLLEEIGPSVLLTHSSTGIRGWITGTKSDKVAGIVSYEPGAYVYPEGEVPDSIPRADGMRVAAGRGIPLADFQKLTKFPIQIVWGDFIPRELDPRNVGPLLTLDNRRIGVVRSQLFAEAINRHGGDAEVLILPDIGITGNTHFPMLDLNAVQIADLLSKWLREHGLDKRKKKDRHGGH
jgi:hypothetical protein